LRKSPKLVETLDFTKVPVLEKLVLEDCINLPRVHPSIGVHKKLKVVSLKGCKNLKSLPSKFEMESLEIFMLSGCSKVKKIPEFGGNMECVRKLYLDGTAITKLPASIENLNGLVSLKLKDCKNLVCLPSTIFNLKLLKDVDISRCSKFERLPKILGNAESVEKLDVSGTAIRQVPSSISLLKNLKRLSLEGCKGLSSSNKSWYEVIPFYSKLISPDPVGLSPLLALCSLIELNLRDCNLKAIPIDICSLFSLKFLYLNGNKFVCLPESIGQLTQLENLELRENNLKCLPESIGQLTLLKDLDLRENNLKCLPESIGQLTLLDELLLCENDFVSLPESLGQLTELYAMDVTNCTRLKSLPILPIKIDTIHAEGCKSLEMFPDLSRAKLYLQNCFKLSENQGFIDNFIASIKRHPQVSLSLSLTSKQHVFVCFRD
jgi:Leucine-rich repeat (LRR) protein